MPIFRWQILKNPQKILPIKFESHFNSAFGVWLSLALAVKQTSIYTSSSITLKICMRKFASEWKINREIPLLLVVQIKRPIILQPQDGDEKRPKKKKQKNK